MEHFNEGQSVITLLDCFSTKAATSRIKVPIQGGERVSVLCEMGGNSAVGATFISAAATGLCHFAVLESTAASEAGSAIAGATLSLGISTANVVSGGCAHGIIQVTTDLTTVHIFNVCGQTFHTATAGPGRDGTQVATEVARIINSHATLSRLVEAVPNLSGSAIIEIWPKPQCTGITMETGDASAVLGARKFQGCINLEGAQLSTHTPKYISVAMSTYAAAEGIRSVKVVKSGPHCPGFTGKVVNL